MPYYVERENDLVYWARKHYGTVSVQHKTIRGQRILVMIGLFGSGVAEIIIQIYGWHKKWWHINSICLLLFISVECLSLNSSAQERPFVRNRRQATHTITDLHNAVEAGIQHVIQRKPFQNHGARLLFLINFPKNNIQIQNRQAFLQRFAAEPRVNYAQPGQKRRPSGRVDPATGRYVIGLYLGSFKWHPNGDATLKYIWIEEVGVGGEYILLLGRGTRGWEVHQDRQTGRF